MAAIEEQGRWVGRMKISSSAEKQTLPGRKRVWRCFDKQGRCLADVVALADENIPKPEELAVVESAQSEQPKKLKGIARCEDLLVPVLKDGRRVAQPEPLTTLRQRSSRAIESLPADLKLLKNPGKYPVYISAELAKLAQQAIKKDASR